MLVTQVVVDLLVVKAWAILGHKVSLVALVMQVALVSLVVLVHLLH